MVGGRALSAEGGGDGEPAPDRPSGGSECHSLSCALRLRVAYASGSFPTLADGVLVVSPPDPAIAVPHHPRCRLDDRPCPNGTERAAERGGGGQPVGQSSGCAGHA